MEIGHAVCIVSILGLLSEFDGFHICSLFKKLRAFAMLPAVRIWCLANLGHALSREACNSKLEASLFWPSKIISNIYIIHILFITYTTCISEKYVWTFYVWSCMIFVVSTPWFLDGRRVSSAPRGKISLRILHWGGSPQSQIWFSALRLVMATLPGRIHLFVGGAIPRSSVVPYG